MSFSQTVSASLRKIVERARAARPRSAARARKRVAVIGAGPSGLTALKELVEQGHDVVAFEQQPTLGGVFANHYDDLLLTSSNINTCFGALPSGCEESHIIWSRAEYLEYLAKYAEQFELFPHIHFSTSVTSLRRDAARGTWHVHAAPHPVCASPHHDRPQPEVLTRAYSSRPALGPEGASFEVDHVAVCSGANRLGSTPAWPGLEGFGGQVIHSARYWRPEEFADRRVLVVGLGESGSDIALQVARVARASAVSTREGPGYIIPRYYNGCPTDVDTSRCYHAIPLPVMESRVFELKSWLLDRYMGPDDDPQVLRLAAKINAERGISAFRRFGTKNTSFVEAVLYHGMQYKPDVERIEGNRVVFVDESSFDCDVIVFCTGYRTCFPFFEQHHAELADVGARIRSLYKRMIDPRFGAELAWIGFVRPGIGSIPPCAELQARYFALLVSGERTLPSPAEMQADIDMHARLDSEHFPLDAGRIAALTDYLRFLESVAERIGCSPPLTRLFVTDPRTWAKVLFGPINGAQYRLVGPGAQPEQMRAILRTMPTMPTPVLAFQFMVLLASKLLYNVSADEAYRTYGF